MGGEGERYLKQMELCEKAKKCEIRATRVMSLCWRVHKMWAVK